MPAPSAFLFDLDGTLADTLPDIAASTNHVRGQHGLPPLPLPAVRLLVGHGARALLAQALAERLPPEGPARATALAAAFAAYCEHHDRACTEHAQVYPGVREHLAALTAQGHPLAVVTNKPRRFAVPIVQALGLARWLPVVVGGDDAAALKPDPAPLRLALERLGAAAATACMVGDGLPDLRAGKLLGVRTIACLYGYGDPAALRAEGADGYWTLFGGPAA
jgi:phosphoglycolate phosphatase